MMFSTTMTLGLAIEAPSSLEVIREEDDAILAQAPEQQSEWGRATVQTMLWKAELMDTQR